MKQASSEFRIAQKTRANFSAISPGFLALALLSLSVLGCKDVSRFTTQPGESYCGTIVPAPFVRNGFRPGVRMRLSLDVDHLSDFPGKMATEDGFFGEVWLRPIPQVAHDPFSTLQFGEGRSRNLIFGVEPKTGPTAFAVISLMDSGNVEVRILRGAPFDSSEKAIPSESSEPLFGLFPLERQKGTCGF